MEKIEGVLVAGAGPVGLLTALRIARAGIPVTVIDAESSIVSSPRALVYHPPTVQVLDELEILEDARAVGIIKSDHQIRELESGQITVLNSSMLKSLTNYPFSLHLGQHVLAEIILRHLSRLPNADIRWDTRVEAVSQNTTGVTATVRSGTGEHQIGAPWLVGADGARSCVRRALDLEFVGHTWPDRFVATNVYYDFEAYGFAKSNFIIDPVNWAIVVKINNDNLWRVTYGELADISEDEVRNRVPEHFKAILPEPKRYELDAVTGYRVHERSAGCFRVGRVMLAGDAAHVCNPIGGYGLTGGLLDAVAVGEALGAVINGQASDDMLDRCLAERRRVFLEVASPGASENKRRIAESDPAKMQQDRDHLRRLREEPEYQKRVASYSLLLAGNPDWRNAHEASPR